MKIKLIAIYWVLFFKFSLVQAQIADTLNEKEQFSVYHSTPVWISMMNDPNVNYFEACTAFEMYWTGREIPAEEEGEANKLYENKDQKKSEREKERERERKKKEGSYKKEEHEEEEGLHFKDPRSYAMIYEYKRFINWRRVMSNKIDPQTGRILTKEEQDAIWKNQIQGVNTHIE